MTPLPGSATATASRWQRWGWPVVGTVVAVVLVAACTDAATSGDSVQTPVSTSPSPVAGDMSGDPTGPIAASPTDDVMSQGSAPSPGSDLTGAMLVADDQLGGDTTAFAATQNAFGLPVPTLTTDERRSFEIGDSFFTQPWVQAPASTDARDGLGPYFNANACAACHVRDGRGEPPSDDHDGPGLLFRVSLPGVAEDGGPLPYPGLGG